MKKKFNIASLLIPAAFAAFYFGLTSYQDTETFQGIMKFLFNPGMEHALPPFWQKYRMFLLAGLVLLVALYYRPTWELFRNLTRVYRDSPEMPTKPSMSPLQASYYYQQAKTGCLKTWLLEMCVKGALVLHYEDGIHPWTIERKNKSDAPLQDRELLDTLLQENSLKQLKAFINDPDPDARDTANALFKRIADKEERFFQPRQSAFPAWLLLLLLIAEIPFYMASSETFIGMTLPAVLFATVLGFAPAYVFCYYLADYMTGSKAIPLFMVVLSLCFSLSGIHLVFSSSGAAPYFETGLYPGLVAALLGFIYNLPLFPRSVGQFAQVIGYRKFLSAEGHRMQEEELPWSIGLGVHADSISPPFQYAGSNLPEWLRAKDETDIQNVLKILHQTFATHVSNAVTGEMKFSRSSGTGMGERY